MMHLWIALLASLTAAQAADHVTVRLAVPDDGADSRYELRADWLGQELRVPMEGAPIAVGELEGEELRYLNMEIWKVHPQAFQLYSAVEPLHAGEVTLEYASGNGGAVQRVSKALPGGSGALEKRISTLIGAGFAWWVLSLLGVLALVRRKPGPQGRPLPALERLPVVFALLLGCAVLWTWPAVLANPEMAVGRNFDTLGTIWSLAEAPRLLSQGLMDPQAAWPLGADFRRFDSYTLLPVAWLLQWIDAARLHGWMQVLGVALSGTAAAWFSRQVGARGLWPLAAGALYGMSGLAATVALEGHVYHLLNPWLALFAGFWWRALSAEGKPWEGAAAGAFFVLCAATTGYQGVSAAILALAFFGVGLARQGLQIWKVSLAAAAVVAVGTAPMIWLMATGGDSATDEARVVVVALSALSWPDWELDRRMHSYGLHLSGLALALLVVSRPLWKHKAPGRALLLVFALTLGLAVGNPATSQGLPPLGLVTPLILMGADAFLRFPVRLFWSGLLCMAALAAWAGTRLEAERGGRMRWLVPLILLEGFLIHRLPLRQHTQIAAVPAVYAQAEGPVLDLLPIGGAQAMDQSMYFNSSACLAVARHHHATAEHCTSTDVVGAVRPSIVRELEGLLLGGDGQQVGATLRALGFRHVAFHPELYSRGDRQQILRQLERIGPVVQSTDGGEWIAWLTLDPGAAHDPKAAFSGFFERAPRAYGQQGDGGEHMPTQLHIQAIGSPATAKVQLAPDPPVQLREMGKNNPAMSGLNEAHVAVPHSYAGRLTTWDAQGRVLWDGELGLAGHGQLLTLDGGVPRPQLPVSIDAPLRQGSTRVARIGAGVYLLFAVGVGLLLWRDRRKQAPSPEPA